MRRVVYVLASGVAFVLALGVPILALNVGLAQDAQPVECPPESTYEEVAGAGPLCTNTIEGTPGDDRLVGSNDTRIVDKMWGYGGNDRLYGRRGKDGMAGGGGRDTLDGGPEGDGLFGEAGRDTIYGESGADEVHAGDGKRDIINCGRGNDRVVTLDTTLDDPAQNCEDTDPSDDFPEGIQPYRGFWARLMGKG